MLHSSFRGFRLNDPSLLYSFIHLPSYPVLYQRQDKTPYRVLCNGELQKSLEARTGVVLAHSHFTLLHKILGMMSYTSYTSLLFIYTPCERELCCYNKIQSLNDPSLLYSSIPETTDLPTALQPCLNDPSLYSFWFPIISKCVKICYFK